VTSAGSWDGFIASYAADGTFRWGKLIGGVAGPNGAPQDAFYDVATDADGNVYLTGHISAVTNFGGVTLDPKTNTLQSAMVVASYTNTGTLRWARMFPRANNTDGSAWSSGRRISVSSSGIVAVAGNFVGDFDFGGGVLFGGPSQQNQPAGVFVTLSAANGTFLQQRGILSGVPITFRQIQFGPNGDLYAVGNASNVGADFGGGTKGSGPFVARYHGDLSFVSAQVASSGAYPYANAISVRPDGSSLLMGSTLTGINWGFGTGTSAGGQDIWLTWFP
jgi:hypothetical protein